MDATFYLNIFQQAADKLDRKLLKNENIEQTVRIYLKSVCLKLYKIDWANPKTDPITSESRIFFSIWIDDAGIAEKKVYYNIHALKLRKLKGYSIESRKFAETFRVSFKKFENQWKNVSTDFGPLTLMQGWIEFDLENLQADVLQLAKNFLDIEYLVDICLEKFRLQKKD